MKHPVINSKGQIVKSKTLTTTEIKKIWAEIEKFKKLLDQLEAKDKEISEAK